MPYLELRKWSRRVGTPIFLIYFLHITCPKEEHFKRYIEERRKFEPEFALRLDHPQCRVHFEQHFIYSYGQVDSCGFRQRNTNAFGSDTGLARYKYYGIINNFWHEKRLF